MFVLYFWLILRAFHLKQPKADITIPATLWSILRVPILRFYFSHLLKLLPKKFRFSTVLFHIAWLNQLNSDCEFTRF